MSFLDDLKGSIIGGGHLNQLLARPFGKAWLYFFILLIIVSFLVALPKAVNVHSAYVEAAGFLAENFDSVVIVNGQIANMPSNRIDRGFKKWSISIDTSFTDSAAAAADTVDIGSGKLRVFIGPKAAFAIDQGHPTAFFYPTSFSSVVKTDKMLQIKSYLLPVIIIALFAAFYIVYVFSGLFYVLVIALIIVFKFRSIGLQYKTGFHAGLYLVTIQLLISMFLGIPGVTLPYGFLWYIIFYIIYISLFVNISKADTIGRTPST